jgi:Domain of unknown function (DUF4412)
MKPIVTILAGALLVSPVLAAAGWAGVVIDEQVTTSQPSGPAVTNTRELMVQGHKEKMVSERNIFVIDLDKGTMMLVDPDRKIYAQMPFPPPMRASASGNELNLNFKKTGKRSNVAGYACTEYAGAGHNGFADVTTSGCFSTSAPGADEFSEFTKAMAARLKNANAMAGTMPQGIPLTMDSTRKISGNLVVPGVPPEQAARIKELMSKQPPQTTKTTVVKIATRSFPSDTFDAPAGYERSTPMVPGARPAPAAPPSGGSGMKVPE